MISFIPLDQQVIAHTSHHKCCCFNNRKGSISVTGKWCSKENEKESNRVGNQQDYIKDKGAEGAPVCHQFRIFVKNPNVGSQKDKVGQYEDKTCAPNAVPFLCRHY